MGVLYVRAACRAHHRFQGAFLPIRAAGLGSPRSTQPRNTPPPPRTCAQRTGPEVCRAPTAPGPGPRSAGRPFQAAGLSENSGRALTPCGQGGSVALRLWRRSRSVDRPGPGAPVRRTTTTPQAPVTSTAVAQVAVHPPGCDQAPRPRQQNPPAGHPHTTQKKGVRPKDNPHNTPQQQGKPPAKRRGALNPKKTVAATYSPTPPQGSTISARRLNDRVRKVTGCDPPTITTTETNTHTPTPPHKPESHEAGKPESTSYVNNVCASTQLSAADKPSAY